MTPNTAKTANVKLINISDKPVVVTKAVTSCGCTTAGTPKDPIPVGGSAEVEIALKPGPATGVILDKKVVFQIDGYSPMVLLVHGTVPLIMTASPETMDAPAVGQSSAGEVSLKCLDGTPFRITNVVPPVVPDISPEAKLEHTVHIDWNAWNEKGRALKVTFATDHPKMRTKSITIRRPVANGDKTETKASRVDHAADHESDLIAAVRSGNIEQVKAALGKQGVDVNTPGNEGGRSALHWAAVGNSAEIISLLLAAKANVDIRDRIGKTPLCVAGEMKDPKCVGSMKLLLDAKADVNSVDRLGGTPLLWGAGLGTPEAVELLIKSGATIDVPDKNGYTALMWAAGVGDPRSVQSLIEHKADLTAVDNKSGDTAVMRAARMGKRDSLLALIKSGANLETRNRTGQTAWLAASQDGTVELLKTLKEAKVDTSVQDYQGWNALDYARNRGNQNRIEVIKYLEIELGMKSSRDPSKSSATAASTSSSASNH